MSKYKDFKLLTTVAHDAELGALELAIEIRQHIILGDWSLHGPFQMIWDGKRAVFVQSLYKHKKVDNDAY